MKPGWSSTKWEPLTRVLRLAAWSTTIVFVVEAVYLYGTKFLGSIHSDAAVTALLARKILASGDLIPRDFYWANGDVWVLGPHLFALGPVAIWGFGPGALFVAVVLGFVTELVVLAWAYRQLSGDLRVAVFATAITMLAWSRIHVLFVYVELSYGFITALYLSMFVGAAAWTSRSATPGRAGTRAFAVLVPTLLFLAALQNPPRALVFGLVPLLACFGWFWYGQLPLRLRVEKAVVVCVAWGAAFAIYRFVFRRVLTFSRPSGHNAFVVKDLPGMLENVQMLGRGLAGIAGGRNGLDALAVLGLVMIVGALAFVVREIFRERALSMTRFVCIASVAQLLVILGPMVIGNLVVTPPSARYLMPSIFQVLGLAVVIVARDMRARPDRTMIAWMFLVPVVAALSAARLVGTYTLEGEKGQWGHTSAHAALADELTRRGLTHGFSAYWNSTLVSLLSHGWTRTCAVQFADRLIPYKWVTEVACYDKESLPDRIYVVVGEAERDEASRAIQWTLGIPIERFDVGGVFDVLVFRRDDVSLEWLAFPLPEAEELRFPLYIAATHPMVKVGKGTTERDGVIATAEEGAVSFGPYLTLPRGHYRLRWLGTGVPSSGEIGFDIGANDGKDNLGQASRPASSFDATTHARLVELEFDLPRTTSGVEFRSYSRGGGRVKLEEIVLERLSTSPR